MDWGCFPLPPDVLSTIFTFLGAHEVVTTVERVCSAWRAVSAHNGQCWQTILQAPRVELQPHRVVSTDRIKCVAFHDLQPTLLCSCYDGTVCLYNYVTDKMLGSVTPTDFPIRAALFSPFSNEVICGDDSGRISVLDLGQRMACTSTTRIMKGRIRAMAVIQAPLDTGTGAHEGEADRRYWLLVAGSDGCMRLLDPEAEWKAVQEFRFGYYQAVMCLCPCPWDRAQFASGTLQSEIHLWTIDAGGTASARRLRGHTKCVNSVKYSETKKWLLSCADDAVVIVWDASAPGRAAVLRIFPAHDAPITALCLIPHLVVSGAEDGSVLVSQEATLQKAYYCRVPEMGRAWALACTALPADFGAGGAGGGGGAGAGAGTDGYLLAIGTDNGLVLSKICTEALSGAALRKKYLRSLRVQPFDSEPQHPNALPSPATTALPFLVWGCWAEKLLTIGRCLAGDRDRLDRCPPLVPLLLWGELLLGGLWMLAYTTALCARGAWHDRLRRKFVGSFAAFSVCEIAVYNSTPSRCGAGPHMLIVNVGTAAFLLGSLVLYLLCPARRHRPRRPLARPRGPGLRACAECCPTPGGSESASSVGDPVPWHLGQGHDSVMDLQQSDDQELLQNPQI